MISGWSNMGISYLSDQLLSSGPEGRYYNQGGIITEALCFLLQWCTNIL